MGIDTVLQQTAGATRRGSSGPQHGVSQIPPRGERSRRSTDPATRNQLFQQQRQRTPTRVTNRVIYEMLQLLLLGVALADLLLLAILMGA